MEPRTEQDRRLSQTLLAARRGERAEFERLMRSYTKFLHDLVIEGMGPRLRAVLEIEDVVQDVMLAVYRGIREADFPSDKAFRGWLRTLVRNRIIDLTRRHFGTLRHGTPPASLDETRVGANGQAVHTRDVVAADQRTVSSIVSRREAVEALDRILQGVPPQYRDLIRMIQVERLSTREIAVRMGKTPGAVRAMLSHALGACRQVLHNETPGRNAEEE